MPGDALAPTLNDVLGWRVRSVGIRLGTRRRAAPVEPALKSGKRNPTVRVTAVEQPGPRSAGINRRIQFWCERLNPTKKATMLHGHSGD